MPSGAATTKTTSSTPTSSTLISFEMVTVMSCCSDERSAAPITGPSQCAVPPIIGLADKAHAHAAELSQVELRKLELARAMAARPKLLISDEAMAGLAGAEIDEVLAILFKLNESGITVIMIEHIMQAVMRFSQRVICLDAGKIICEGTPASIVQNTEVQKAYLGA